jgi:uncharacterized glyoxalase superfamily protein PhnB
MSERPRTAVWPTLTYADAPAAIRFLTEAFGFEVGALYTHPDDESIVDHCELRWPLGGGVMFGTAGKDDGEFGRRPTGTDSVYVVCTDPDALLEQARAAGAEVVIPIKDEDFGSRTFTVRDPEGNLWTFGTYAGA